MVCSENSKKYSQGGVSNLRQGVVGNELRPDVWPLEGVCTCAEGTSGLKWRGGDSRPGRSWGLGNLEGMPLAYIGTWNEKEWNTEVRAQGATWGVGAGLHLGATLGRRCEVRGTPRWPIELAFCYWLAIGRKRKVQDRALWETVSQRRSSVWDTQH